MLLRQVVLAGGNENLGAGDLVAAVALLHRLGADHAEVGAAVRLGQVHGSGPFAGHHLGEIRCLLLRGAMHQDRRDRALGETRIHRESQIGGGQELIDLLGHEHRQALAAEFAGCRNSDPAAFDDLPVGILEALRRGHAAVGIAGAAFDVADPVERGEHVLAELGGLAEDRLYDVGRSVRKAWKIGITLDVEHVVEQEHHVVDRRLVARHGFRLPGPRIHSALQPPIEVPLKARKATLQAGNPSRTPAG